MSYKKNEKRDLGELRNEFLEKRKMEKNRGLPNLIGTA
jgi:hypothetical protein